VNDHDSICNPTSNETFEEVLTTSLSRRSVIAGGLGAAALTFFGGQRVAAAGAAPATAPRPRDGWVPPGTISFTSIPLQAGPLPTVAPEYTYQVILPWREKLDGSGESFDYVGFTAEQQEQSIGIGHDGMWYFGNNQEGWLCLNHEFGTNPHVFGAATPTSLEQVRLSQAAHGVTVVRVRQDHDQWRIKRNRRNRRITVNTPMAVSGPAAGSPLLQNPGATPVLGTLNNCANGYTPWGTYLTCEENFNGYFGAPAGTWTATTLQRRYGFSNNGFGYGWHLFDPRFDLSNTTYTNEENRFGWVVEIDPRGDAAPVKRTALGRMKHEGATFVTGKGGKAVVYMGDDERFEYIYKFVSADRWRTMRSAGMSPLDEGTLYVAKFNADGTGQWIELSPANPLLAGWTLDQILVNARGAGDVVGATKMDRPEWITVGKNQEVFCTLTNNSRRGTSGNPGTDAANPQGPNPWGHIIRWVDADRHTGLTFTWDIFALATDVVDGAGQMFGSPDGMWADADGRVFVQTDGEQPGGNNDQMLVADPVTREFRRLFTGPKGCEVTGVAITPNQWNMFINVQHPGDGVPAVTNFPVPNDPADPAGPVPRDATIVLRRLDYKPVGI
jgi:secreted PhoX family phosphatase